MRDPDKYIKEILSKFGEDFETNTWLLPGGKARAIKHHCTERMAAKAGVSFSMPDIISAAPDNVVLLLSGNIFRENEPALSTWSFGEAAPKNNKNAYPYAIAEKRAKARVALKLLGLHGLLHDETETFVEDDRPARPAGNGEVKSSRQAKKDGDWGLILGAIDGATTSSDLLRLGENLQPRLRSLSAAWQDEALEAWGKALAHLLVEECHTAGQTRQWGLEYASAIEALPMEWINTARAVCTEHMKALRIAADKAALEAVQ